MKNKTLLTLCAAPLLLSVNAMAEDVWPTGAVTITGGESPYSATIDDEYIGDEAINNPGNPMAVNSITYNRTFTTGVPATVVFPFTFPSGTTINADFYDLDYVIPYTSSEGKTWLARMKPIAGLPQANKPYAVIPRGNSMTIDLGGQNASFQTSSITKQYNSNYNESLYKVDGIESSTNNANDWYFTGTYQYKDWSTDSPEEVGICYAFTGRNNDRPEGRFGKIGTKTKAAPMHAYLCKKSADVRLPQNIKQNGSVAKSASVFSLPETIDVEFVKKDADGKEHTTYVGTFNRIDNIRLNRERSTFDLKGRNVDGKKTAKGVYLKK